jgi:hypothetical protein
MIPAMDALLACLGPAPASGAKISARFASKSINTWVVMKYLSRIRVLISGGSFIVCAASAPTANSPPSWRHTDEFILCFDAANGREVGHNNIRSAERRRLPRKLDAPPLDVILEA